MNRVFWITALTVSTLSGINCLAATPFDKFLGSYDVQNCTVTGDQTPVSSQNFARLELSISKKNELVATSYYGQTAITPEMIEIWKAKYPNHQITGAMSPNGYPSNVYQFPLMSTQTTAKDPCTESHTPDGYALTNSFDIESTTTGTPISAELKVKSHQTIFACDHKDNMSPADHVAEVSVRKEAGEVIFKNYILQKWANGFQSESTLDVG
jgi:hypothetical protein